MVMVSFYISAVFALFTSASAYALHEVPQLDTAVPDSVLEIYTDLGDLNRNGELTSSGKIQMGLARGADKGIKLAWVDYDGGRPCSDCHPKE